MNTQTASERIAALARVAERWQDPDHPPRQRAAAETLTYDNRFTSEAVAFAVNQQMALLTEPALTAWAGTPEVSAEPLTVGVIGAGNVPLADLQDFLAVALSGHRFLGHVSSKSPLLLPAFVREVQAETDLSASFGSIDDVFEASEALIATGTDETLDHIRDRVAGLGLPTHRLLLRGNRFAVAVIDGKESLEGRGGLAEDALLHEGFGCRNVAIIWAPAGLSPDPYLDPMAQLREVFPAHANTNPSLRMPRAFLKATNTSHAFGEGFLLSKGEPEPQQPGHIRWAEYETLDAVNAWLVSNEDRLQLIAARPAVQALLAGAEVEHVELGDAQRPRLDWNADGRDVMDFVRALSR